MGNKRYPDLTQREFREIIESFLGKRKRTKGDHEYYIGSVKGVECHLQIDCGRDPVFGYVIPDAIERLGVSREEFYGCSKSAAKKIRCEFIPRTVG